MQKGSSKGIGRGKSEASKANLKGSKSNFVDSFDEIKGSRYEHNDFLSYKKKIESDKDNDFKKMAEDIKGTLNKNELSLILGYTDKDFVINKDILDNDLTNDKKEHITALDKALSKLKSVEEGTILYRGKPFNTTDKLYEFTKTHKQGNELRFDTFTSTSIKQEVARGFSDDNDFGSVVYKIKAKKNSNGKNITKLSRLEKEEEVLFKTKSRFKITNIVRNSFDNYEVELEEL